MNLSDTFRRSDATPLTLDSGPTLISGDGGVAGDLELGETWVYEARYVLTQADVDAGGVINSALVQAKTPAGGTVTDLSDDGNAANGGDTPTSVPIPASPTLETTKLVVTPGSAVGDVVVFEVSVENTGNVSLSSVAVTDDLRRADGVVLSPTSGPVFLTSTMGSGAGDLLPGEVATYRVTYALVQADIDAGGVTNSATATATPPIGSPITDGTDTSADVVIVGTSGVTLTKSLEAGATGTFDSVGDVLPFEFVVTNTGNVTLTGTPVIADPLITGQGGSVSCPAGPLVPAASLTCTGSYVVTQADLDAGQVVNTASATMGGASSGTATATVPADVTSALSMTKTAAPMTAGEFFVGAVATYDYVVTNSGNVTATQPITVADNLIPSVSCPALPVGGLAPGASLTCTGSYTVTSNDVHIGSVTNLATAQAGATISPIVSDTIPDAGIPALGISKSSPTVSYATVGDLIDYSFVVTNTGTRAFVTDIDVVDDKIGTIACYSPSASDPDFRPGEIATCVGTYSVMQADLDAGSVTNQAYASTFTATSVEVVSPPRTVTVNASGTAAIDLTKVTTSAPVTGVGDVIDYTLTVENIGNRTLSSVSVSDPGLSGFTCSAAALAPTQTTVCTGSHTVTQADIDAGQVLNMATASAYAPDLSLITDTASHIEPMPAAAGAMTLTKIAAPDPFGPVGSTLTYRFDVTNTGNVTLSNLVLNDPFGAGYTCVLPDLAPGVSDQTCSFSTVVTQAQVDAGDIQNTASVTGEDPSGAPVTAGMTLTTNGPAQIAAIEATNTVVPVAPVAGQVLVYTLTLENTGNVTLDTPTLTPTIVRLDNTPLALDAPYAYQSGDTNGDGRIDPGEIWVYTANYTLVQADIDEGGVANSVYADTLSGAGATAADISDDGDDSDGNTSDDPTVYLASASPALNVVKSISTTGANVGDTVVFDIVAQNVGNQSLSNLSVADQLRRADGTLLTGVTILPVSVPAAIAPGETATWQATYVLVQDDLDAGGLANSATVSADTPASGSISDISADDDPTDGNISNDPTDLILTPVLGMEVIKTVTQIGTAAGNTADFVITVENKGTVTLSQIAVADQMTNGTGSTVGPVSVSFVSADAGSVAGTLLPGEVATYSATYVLTQADIDSGSVANSATATASTALGSSFSDVSDDDGSGFNDPTLAVITGSALLNVSKTVTDVQLLFPTVSQTTFDILVTNSGSLTQTGIAVSDDLAAFVAPATLMSGTYPLVVTTTGFSNATINPSYDGVTDTNLLSGNPTLAPGETGTVTLVITYMGQPGSANVVNVNSNQSPTATSGSVTQVTTDTDGDGIPDSIEGSSDRDGDGVPNDQDYDPTGYFYCEDDGRILTGGQISVTDGTNTQMGVGTSGPINIVEDGSTGSYQFFVTAPGTYTLALTYPAGGTASDQRLTSGTLDATSFLPQNPGVIGSGEDGATGRLVDFTAGANRFYTAFVVEAGDPMLINNNIPLTACAGGTDIVATKNADRREAVFGETVTFTLGFRNDSARTITSARLVDMLPEGMIYAPGSATLDGVATEPSVDGQSLTWTRDLAPGDAATIRLSARVSTSSYGDLINSAYALDVSGALVSNTAEAQVLVRPEAVFACSDIIGKVFDDRNRNGVQDGPDALRGITQQDIFSDKFTSVPEQNMGEPGLAGVRLVTADGTYITTDTFGRFSVPCASLPKEGGSNFILKLDSRTLPTGYQVHSENPLVQRVTPGKLTKFNYAVSLVEVIRIDLTAAAFNGMDPTDALDRAIRDLLDDLQTSPSALDLRYVRGAGEALVAAEARLREIERNVRGIWRSVGAYDLQITSVIVEGGE